MYIRTKNGRIIDTTKIVTGSKFMDFATNDESFRIIFKTEPLAKSENLEELCDEFVLINNNVFTVPQIITHTNFQNTKAYREDYGKFETIYGAIWTFKGLIYVAKMNDKGDLELI